jgi:hypothetical protein
MAKKYLLCRQEKDNWCLPACLESVLKSRGFFISQSQISEKLVVNNGCDLSVGLLDKFLKEYNLKCRFSNPNLDYESDLVLKEELNDKNDVLVAYNYQELHKIRNSVGKHISIVQEYNSLSDEVRLIDPSRENAVNVQLIDLNNAILYRLDSRYGFYIIN